MLHRRLGVAAGVLALTVLAAAPAASAHGRGGRTGHVFTETNATKNAVIAYDRAANGTLHRIGAFATGGAGSGLPRVSSQGTVVLTENNRFLLVSNLGDNTVSVFRVRRHGLRLVDRVASGGSYPDSIAVHDGLVYVLNNGLTDPSGTGNVTGFRLSRRGHITPLAGSTRPLSVTTFTKAAQAGFSPSGDAVVVTEEDTDTIDRYTAGPNGRLSAPVAHHSEGKTPFGFAFTRRGDLIVSEAELGAIGAATVSSYRLGGPSGLTPLSSAVRDTQSEVCWAVITKDQRFVYVSNFGSSTISSYTVAQDGTIALHEAVAADTGHSDSNRFGVRDEALSADSRYFYAIDITTQRVHAWAVDRATGALEDVGSFGGITPTLTGLAAY